MNNTVDLRLKEKLLDCCKNQTNYLEKNDEIISEL